MSHPGGSRSLGSGGRATPSRASPRLSGARFVREGPRIVHVDDHPDDLVPRLQGKLLRGIGIALLAAGWLGSQFGGAPGWLFASSWVCVAIGLLLMFLGGRILDAIEKRTWARFCQANGWTYTHVDKARPQAWDGAHPFNTGHHHVARNVVQGRPGGVDFEAWNLQFQTGSGKSRRTHNWRVVVVPMPVPSPGLTIERETAGKKLFDAFGGEDVDFESDEFSRTFWVQCPDRRFAYAVIDARMMEFLMGAGAERAWLWKGRALAATVEGKMDRRSVTAMLPDAQAFRAHVPRHVVAGPGGARALRSTPPVARRR